MLDNASAPQFEEQREELSPHHDAHDARELIRRVQCPHCSKPFTAPVTLLCGHTVCQKCLPAPKARANISYPSTPGHQMGIACPTCGQVDSAVECNVDVTFAKLMELMRFEISKHIAQHPDPAMLLEEVIERDEGALSSEVKIGRISRSAVFHGGRLASTFEMAAQGLLSYSADVSHVVDSHDGEDDPDLDTDLLERLRKVALDELDCPLCYNIMLEPTTTTCGHTLCRRCLIRSFDHSNICPVCRRTSYTSPTLIGHPSNQGLVSLMNALCPDQVIARRCAIKEEESPAAGKLDTPLFVCTLSLPTMPTFLHIFEPRYRLMIRRCIEGNGRFGMLMYNRASEPQGELGVTRFLEYGTLLQIVSCELLPDGRSFVETKGISRFRVLEHGIRDGYDVGRIERVDDVSLSQEMRLEEEDLVNAQRQAQEYNSQNPQVPLTPANFPPLLSTLQIFHTCKSYIMAMGSQSQPWLSQKFVNVYGECPDDPALFPYWFASVLPITEEEKYLLLKTTSVRERLKIVHNWIGRIQAKWYVY
jgi:Lon protease-like protein